MGKISKTTNVQASQLNYDKYSSQKYDRDITNSIPFHREIHKHIIRFISENFDKNKEYAILDLGVGTGITSKVILDLLPNSKIDAVDFSKQMLSGAKRKLGQKNVNYLLGDYSKMNFSKKYDIIVSVIGLHHQNQEGKKRLFKKIHSILNNHGIFIFGDLVTYRNKHLAALNNALHFHHLAEKSTDKKTLAEWAYHHMFLNDLSPIEDQIDWLKRAGFSVKKNFLIWNTALLICKK